MQLEPMLNIENDLLSLITSNASQQKYAAGDIVVSQNMKIDQTAFLTKGLLKAHIEEADNSLMLYHIQMNNNPVLNFIKTKYQFSVPVSVTAVEESTLLWVSNSKIIEWSEQYLSLKKTIVNSHEYNLRQMLLAVKNLAIHSLDDRLFDYLKTKASIYNDMNIKISRTEIASDLNTSKATISRVLKRLENENKVIGKPRSIALIA
ncbi:Crp/Fnr family transcriptional regulator [Aquimarina sp. 2201CG5-10]|uniref:Crp/Fnr family transcriptional regulator n=1 Tax=Aquimarina callyspongiae TaxID=3098150 RepID=UPI002AB559BF|nr:Crp/Fnr family transcriptional regulator [Aquimarina sp. 2201CG5-10]MDY8135751.1 Crp/Fnr family transcriptional regulator [Aquimarina sp. 2201CG5-10]